MKKILLAGAVILLISAIGVAIWLHVPDTSLDGRQLSALLVDLTSPKHDVRDSARAALRNSGDKALPTLLQLIQATESSSQQTFTALVGLPYHSAADRRLSAARAIAVLGAQAKPLIPDLIKLLPNEETYSDVVNALRFIGPDAVPALVEALSSPEHLVRKGAAAAVGQNGDKAAAAVPMLIKLLKDPEADVHYWAVESLGNIGLEAATVVPALIPVVEADQGETSSAAAIALGAFKEQAKDALPALKKVSKSKTQSTRDAAKASIRIIEAKLSAAK